MTSNFCGSVSFLNNALALASISFAHRWRVLTLLMAVLATTGSAQTADDFNPGGGLPYSLAIQPDGMILLGQEGGGSVHRITAGGTVDTYFYVDNVDAMAIAVQPDAKILIGTFLGPVPSSIRRFNANGTPDNTFNSPIYKTVYSVVVQEDGKILVGGDFSGGRKSIARLNTNGTFDTTFNTPGTLYYPIIFSIAVQPDGKILVGGSFSSLGGQNRWNIARLESNGAVDTTFNPGAGTNANAVVYALAIQPDGKILVGGQFTTLGGQPRENIGRLDANGVVDDAFVPGAAPGQKPSGSGSGEVNSIMLQTDGKVVVGGGFMTLAGQPRTAVGRFLPDGTLDPSFDVAMNGLFYDPDVYSLGIQDDGKILVGGYFTNLAGQSRTNIGRLNNTDMPFESLSAGGSMIWWMRGGASPEVWRTTFETSTDGTNWLSAGAGTRIPGGWQMDGATLTTNTTIRARGYVTGANNNGSSWFVERRAMLGPKTAPRILANDGSFGAVSNTFGFHVAGLPGQTAIVEASTNLLDWVSVWANALGSEPSYFSDSSCPDSPRRFYRARLQ